MSAELRVYQSLSELAAADWDGLVAQDACLRHAFLSAFEDSGCVAEAAGWGPCHLTLWRGDRLVAALPRYEKRHSYGEFVFDWAWADAYQRAGLAYYPKLLTAVPFTPVPGPRLLAVDAAARSALLAASLDAAQLGRCSSWHVLFPTEEETALLAAEGLSIRQSVQFHWGNPGYRDFSDFLDTLTRDKRKKIRQERRRVAEAGIALHRLRGTEATPEDWRFLHRCYVQTYAERGRQPYLNLDFFQRLARSFADHVVLVMAEQRGRPVAAVMNVADGERLYGRYWGAVEYVPGLHFEACYYQGIEHCIEQGLAVFEGGAQGEHKLARGFLPVRTTSAHWLRNARFAGAIKDYVAREADMIDRYVAELSEHSPYSA